MNAQCFPDFSPVGMAYRGPETGGGFCLKHYSKEFGQPSGGPVSRLASSYMLGSPVFTPWSPFVRVRPC